MEKSFSESTRLFGCRCRSSTSAIFPLRSAKPKRFESRTEDVRRPFDLSVAPLFRVRLVRWAPDYHRIYLTVHHLVFDGVSIYRVLIRELAALYSAFPPASRLHFPNSPSNMAITPLWKQQPTG